MGKVERVTPWYKAPLTTTAPLRERRLKADGGGGTIQPKIEFLSSIFWAKTKFDSQIVQVLVSLHVRQFYGQVWQILLIFILPYPHPLFGIRQLPFVSILSYKHVKHILEPEPLQVLQLSLHAEHLLKSP